MSYYIDQCRACASTFTSARSSWIPDEKLSDYFSRKLMNSPNTEIIVFVHSSWDPCVQFAAIIPAQTFKNASNVSAILNDLNAEYQVLNMSPYKSESFQGDGFFCVLREKTNPDNRLYRLAFTNDQGRIVLFESKNLLCFSSNLTVAERYGNSKTKSAKAVNDAPNIAVRIYHFCLNVLSFHSPRQNLYDHPDPRVCSK